MIKTLKKRLKNQRGLTLVELLAVVVILGIISAIAVPSVGSLIDNSKKDAHIANAQQLVSATKLALASDPPKAEYNLKELVEGGYIEPVKNPSLDAYLDEKSKVVITTTGNVKTYTVTLVGTGDKTHLTGDVSALTRASVTLK